MLKISEAANIIRRGGIVAYPTEAVFGLGCDPNIEAAVKRIYRLKKRPHHCGMILIAENIDQITSYCKAIPENRRQIVAASWPGAHTWLFPITDSCPKWLTGGHDSIAVRVTAHPIAAALCRSAGCALVSTSANRHGEPPATTAAEVARIFPLGIDGIVTGKVAGASKPTPIADAISGTYIRT